MHFWGFVFAQFAHVAHHKHARRGQLGEHIQRGFHAVGVGVVGVVQNQGLADTVFALQPPFNVAKRRQTAGDFRLPQAASEGERGGGASIAHIMLARHRQLHRLAVAVVHQIKRATQRFKRNIFGVDIACDRTKSKRLERVGGSLKNGKVGILGRQDGDAVFRQPLVNLGFGAGDVIHAVEAAANVRAHGVVYQRNIGRSDTGERCQFARVVHAHFYHSVAMRLAQIEQRERQADVVVKIARRCQHGIRAVRRAQNGRQHFFHRGFAA